MKKKVSLIVLLILLSFYLFNLFSQNKSKTLVSAQSITTTPACTTKTQGDANCDGAITDADYTIWKCEFIGSGTCTNPASNKTADFNLADNKVDLVDFEIWRKNKFNEPSAPSPTLNPAEPHFYNLIPPTSNTGKTVQDICKTKGQEWNCVNGCEYTDKNYSYYCIACETPSWTTTDNDCYFVVPTTATRLDACCYTQAVIPPTYAPTPVCDPTNCPTGCCLNNSCYSGKQRSGCGTAGATCSVCSTVQECVAGSCVATQTPPTCTSFTSMYINECSPLSEWQISPRSAKCTSTSSNVTLKFNSPTAAEIALSKPSTNNNVTANCADLSDDSFDASQTYSQTKTYTLSSGTGQKKVCVKLTNAAGSAKCGAMIEVNCGVNASLVNGTCACNSGRANCDGNWANGCETRLGTTSNCGSCGNRCTCGGRNKYPDCRNGSCRCIYGDNGGPDD